MKSIFDLLNFRESKEKTIEPFWDLNEIYKDQGLQFDEYGNPTFTTGDPEEKLNSLSAN